MINNAIKDTYNKGFGNECGEEDNWINLNVIILAKNEIKLLRNNTFIRLKNNFLDMSNNHLVEIEEGAFNGLEKLSSLWLL